MCVFRDALRTRISSGRCFEAVHVVVGSLPISTRCCRGWVVTGPDEHSTLESLQVTRGEPIPKTLDTITHISVVMGGMEWRE